MKKKIILLNISKSAAEIDWILPVLYRLRYKYKIFTLFQNLQSYKSLKRDKTLFYLWKKISYGYAIDNIYNKLIRFFSKKIFNKINLKNYFLNKGINLLEVNILLSEFGTYSWIIEEIKKQKIKLISIHFPTSSFIFGIEKKNIKIKYKLNGDLLFLCNKLDIDFWKKRIEKNKIKIVGVQKYDPEWLKRINKKKIIKKKKVILIAYSSRFNLPNTNYKLLEDQLFNIMTVLKNFKNYKIIFKIHPRKNNSHYLKILNKFKEVDWEISKENLLRLTKCCDLFLHDKNSSVIYEGLIMKKPCIEYWDLDEDTNTLHAQDYLKLNVLAKNPKKLDYLIRLAINYPKNKIWKKQYKNFISNLQKFMHGSSKYTSEYMVKIDKNSKNVYNNTNIHINI